MKNLKKMIVLLLALVMVTALVGCGFKSEIVGTWVTEVEGVEMTYEFSEDGGFTITTTTGARSSSSYQIRGDKLRITFIVDKRLRIAEFEYKVTDNKLEITGGGETLVLEKK